MDRRPWTRAVLASAITVLTAILIMANGTPLARADGVPFNIGDVLAGVGNGQIKHFSSAGALLDTLDTTTASAEDTGMCFDGSLNLYATNFTDNSMSTFDAGGNLLGAFGSGFNTSPESCVVDAAGDIYVGQADGSDDVLKFDSSGTLLDTFDVAQQNRGSDWIDLAADQCTLQYTSEGSLIKRYDVCTDTQLPDFASGLPGPCYANRILSDGGALVACQSEIKRLDSTGAVIQTYDAVGEDNWFAMNIDPDGTSFWSANYITGQIYRFDIAAGAVLTSFAGSPNVTLAGLTVVGEQTQAAGCPEGVISPVNVEEVIFPGNSVQIEKCVEVPTIPPKADIVFLADTTGSMGTTLANVQTDAAGILTLINNASSDAQFAVADYKDFACPGSTPYTLGQAVTANTTDVQTAINAWSTFPGAGCDEPEAQLYALDQIATNAAVGFRAGATKIVVWFGDCPAHDPVPTAATGLGSDLTEASVTADLVAGGVKVVGISLNTECPDGLDGDPTVLGGGYTLAYGTVEDGSPGQATRITSATGGGLLANVSPAQISQSILTAIGEVSVEVAMTSTCTPPITTTFEPASQTVPSGGTATFIETISVAANAPGGTYHCDDFATIDGQPLLDETGAVAYEHKVIKVPEGFLTGGGQIATGRGRNAKSISFGGNVGFLADFSLVGQWQTNFHDVGVNALDGAKFHSTSITALQFYNDGGAGPNPPPANANVGSFTATGRLNSVDGYTLVVCLADRGEPGKSDSIRLRLFDPGNVLIYDSFSDFPSQDNTLTGACANRTKLSAGNFQIHSGLK